MLGGADAAQHPRLRVDERARRFAPFRVRPRHHRGFHHLRVAVETLLDFQRLDVLSAGDDDVLGAILDLDVIVRVHHREVAGMEPAVAEGLRRGSRVVQISLHDRVAAQHDLADGRASRGTGARAGSATAAPPASAWAPPARHLPRPLARARASLQRSCAAHSVAGPYSRSARRDASPRSPSFPSPRSPPKAARRRRSRPRRSARS